MEMDLTIHNTVIDGTGKTVTVGIKSGRIAADAAVTDRGYSTGP